MTYTPGLLEYSGQPDGHYPSNGTEAEIRFVSIDADSDGRPQDFGYTICEMTDTAHVEGDMRRLVVCWNACDGIETDSLTVGAVRGLLDVLQKIADAPAWGYPDKWETTPAEVRQMARDAIAMATQP